MENDSTISRSGREDDLLRVSIILDGMWKAFKRWWWLVIGLILVGIAAGYGHTRLTYAPSYEASSTFVVTRKTTTGSSSDYYNQLSATQLSESFDYILTSSVLKKVVAESLGMSYVPATISTDKVTDTALFTIRVRAADPQTAYDVLQAVKENYPTVAEFIIGSTQLELLSETGVPTKALNSPDYARKMILGGLAGLVIGLIFLFLFSSSRRTIHRSSQLEEYISLQSLGEVPKVQFKKRGSNKKLLVLMDKNESGSSLGESMRSIRSKLMRQTELEQFKKIMITSSSAGEGKTTISANLAISLSRKSKRVVLVDGDLRNPSVAEAMGLDNSQGGIIDVLKGEKKAEEVMIAYGRHGRLRVLPGGRPESNPAAYLGSETFAALLDKMCETADYVIVDAAPCGMLSDASVIAPQMDGAIMVVRQDYARINQILAGFETLSDTGIKILGYVMNYMESGITGYGYGYGYGRRKYGYGYGSYGGYGYGEKEAAEEAQAEAAAAAAAREAAAAEDDEEEES